MKTHHKLVVITSITCALFASFTATFTMASDRDKSAEHQCAISYGTTGTNLPSLIQEAIKVFPRDRYALRPDQVVYITNFSGFVDCMGIKSESVRNYLFRQELMVFHNEFPIYFNANEDAVDAFHKDPRLSYLKYVFASYLGNGWMHATGEKNDYPAYSLELLLLQSYKKMLPAGDFMADHFDEVRGLMEESRMKDGPSVVSLRTALNP